MVVLVRLYWGDVRDYGIDVENSIKNTKFLGGKSWLIEITPGPIGQFSEEWRHFNSPQVGTPIWSFPKQCFVATAGTDALLHCDQNFRPQAAVAHYLLMFIMFFTTENSPLGFQVIAQSSSGVDDITWTLDNVTVH